MKIEDAAPRFGVTLTILSSLPPDFDSSLAAIASGRFDGLIVNDNPSLFPPTPRIAVLVAESRTPAVYGTAGQARMGGMVGYSFDASDAGATRGRLRRRGIRVRRRLIARPLP